MTSDTNIKILLVGGTCDAVAEHIKPSGVISKMYNSFVKINNNQIHCINGAFLSSLDNIEFENYNLIIWMPNIDNAYQKKYPIKGLKSTLIVSKMERNEKSKISAVNRIFTMKGNAVILIKENNLNFFECHDKTQKYSFKLIDALGNDWCDDENIDILCKKILEFHEWSSGAKRKSVKKNNDIERLLSLTSIVADKFELCYSRFFGNCSTRCSKMFPSTRFFFSKRNTDKRRLTIEDMVFVDEETGYVCDDNKPSVDTPVQLALYKARKNINFMIHGHSYIDGAVYTYDFYPCGDLREVDEILEVMNNECGTINLKNHGFLIYADTIENLENIVLNCKLLNRVI